MYIRHYHIYLVVILLFQISCTVSKDPRRNEFIQLQKGRIKDDTSFVYTLPFELNKKHRLVQGYFSHFSHKNRAALDFKMKRGTVICAARGGVVVRVKQDGKTGGLNKKYRPEGNMVIIQHSDGSRAGYWHLKQNGSMVKVGDTVLQGQTIAYSGKTGYTAFPHLHFIVWKSAASGWQQVATRFQTSTGIKFLRPFKVYKRK